MNRKLSKRIVGHSIGITAWGCVIAALPEWHFFSLQTFLVLVSFVLASMANSFLDAAELSVWPWETKLTVTGDEDV